MNGRVRGILIAASVLAFPVLTVSVLTLSAGSALAGFQWTAPAPSAIPSPMNARPGELPPRAAAAPIAPVQTESLSNPPIAAGAPIATTPDGPVAAAPIYGNGMTNDPITWNPRSNETYVPRAPHTGNMPQPIVPQQQTQAPMAPIMDDSMGSLSMNPQVSGPQPTTGPGVFQMSATPQMGMPLSSGQYEIAQGFGRDLPLVMAIRQIVPPQYGFVFDQGIDVQKHVSWQGGQPWDIVLQNTLSPMGMQASINGNVVSITRSGGMQMASGAASTMATQTIQTTTTTSLSPSPAVITTPAPIISAQEIMPVPQATPAAASRADLLAQGTWTAPRRSTLRTILEDWSKRADVELYWASEYDYPIQSAVSLNGTFEEAVQVLLKGLYDSKPRPMGRLHPNLPNGPAVLVIETRQNSM